MSTCLLTFMMAAEQKLKDAKKNTDTKLVEGLTTKEIQDNIWMIRPCQVYKDEWDECGTVSGRLHQRYVYGKTLDCQKWMSDFEFCKEYQKTKDLRFAEPIIVQELERRQTRLKGADGNTVWEYRESPPPEWDAPLPEHLKNLSTRVFEDLEQNPGSKVESIMKCTIL